MFCFGSYQTVLSSLAKLDLDPARSAQNLSRTRWVEEGESSSSYFFCLVKKQSAHRLVSALRLPDGKIVNSAQDLVDCFAGFYSSLFPLRRLTDLLSVNSCLTSLRACLLSNLSLVRVSCRWRNECLSVLQGMDHRKAPGNDGLPMEFYVKFWDVLGSDLMRVLNFCRVNNKLSKS